jgi:hypothetical protein
MAVTLTIRDETASGDIVNEIPLQAPSERLTVRELIRERVYQEVQDFNRSGSERSFQGLVQPLDAERVLNGDRPEYRLKQRREIDWKQQFETAVEAFEHNGFFVIIDDQQAESLDQEFTVSSQTRISFLKLTMLVGG